MTEFINMAISDIAQLVSVIAVGMITYYMIPWLKQKQLYDTVETFVLAAQQTLEGGTVKRSWVIESLSALGYKYTEELGAMIEAAVLRIKNEKTES